MRRPAFSALLAVFLCFVRTETVAADTASGPTVAGGLFHTCVLVQDLTLRCFGGGSSSLVKTLAPGMSVKDGFGNFGQLGTGNNETLGDEAGEMSTHLPVVDLGNNTAQQVAAGQSHTCVLLTSRDVACWGYNGNGQLGIGNVAPRGLSPTDMGEGLILVSLGTGRTATHISCGQHHSCAVLDDGSLKCWGLNSFGMLGLGNTIDHGYIANDMGDYLEAVDLGEGRTAVEAAGGRYHTCAILDNGALKCWGGNNSTGHNYGQLGQGSTFDVGSSAGQMGDNLTEIDLGTNRTAVALAVGWFHTCVILDNANLCCFGRNVDGQLGLGDMEDRGDEPGEMGDALQAADLGTGRYAVAVTCGRWHTCVLLDNADVKCFGVNTADDLGAGQLGLEDTSNRGTTVDTTGDGLEVVQLGTGRTSGWVFAAFDHTCVVFEDGTMKCWGLNASGQLGLGHTSDVGADSDTMGNNLSTVEPGLRVAFPPSPASFNETTSQEERDEEEEEKGEEEEEGEGEEEGSEIEEEGRGGLSLGSKIAVYLSAVGGGVFILGAFCVCCRRRLQKQQQLVTRKRVTQGFSSHSVNGRSTPELLEWGSESDAAQVAREAPAVKPIGAARRFALQHVDEDVVMTENTSGNNGSDINGDSAGMAAAGTAGVVIAGGMAAGWNVVGLLAENLPWIGVAYHMLNEIVDVVDTRNAMQGNLERIKHWAIGLRDAIVQMSEQMQARPAANARAMESMSVEVISTLQTLVDTVASYNQKGALAQYAASRSCQKAVDAADTALRGALAKLSIGQGAELISMVGGLHDAGLVVDEKLDMVIEHLRKQEENVARIELRLAEYSESMAEVFGQFVKDKEKGQPPAGKNLRELGEMQLDKLQISKDDVSYPSNLPFASGAHSEVYQVIHEGVIKAAKKTNLARLGVGGKDINRVFGRFVKELYILSQMHSERVVSVYGAIVSPNDLTLVMEFLERGSIRTILDDDAERQKMTPAVQQGLLVDTAAGMTYLYNAGVEHRDLKSANCLVSHDWRVKISDFGLSKTNDAISTGSTSTMSSVRGGTFIYMAPELLPGGVGEDGSVPAELSDIYSFGVIVWDVLCGDGELPWARVSVRALPLMLKMGKRLDIPEECERFYRKLMLNCWREDPHRRPKFNRVLYVLNKKSATQAEELTAVSAASAASSPTRPEPATAPSPSQLGAPSPSSAGRQRDHRADPPPPSTTRREKGILAFTPVRAGPRREMRAGSGGSALASAQVGLEGAGGAASETPQRRVRFQTVPSANDALIISTRSLDGGTRNSYEVPAPSLGGTTTTKAVASTTGAGITARAAEGTPLPLGSAVAVQQAPSVGFSTRTGSYRAESAPEGKEGPPTMPLFGALARREEASLTVATAAGAADLPHPSGDPPPYVEMTIAPMFTPGRRSLGNSARINCASPGRQRVQEEEEGEEEEEGKKGSTASDSPNSNATAESARMLPPPPPFAETPTPVRKSRRIRSALSLWDDKMASDGEGAAAGAQPQRLTVGDNPNARSRSASWLKVGDNPDARSRSTLRFSRKIDSDRPNEIARRAASQDSASRTVQVANREATSNVFATPSRSTAVRGAGGRRAKNQAGAAAVLGTPRSAMRGVRDTTLSVYLTPNRSMLRGASGRRLNNGEGAVAVRGTPRGTMREARDKTTSVNSTPGRLVMQGTSGRGLTDQEGATAFLGTPGSARCEDRETTSSVYSTPSRLAMRGTSGRRLTDEEGAAAGLGTPRSAR